MNIVVLDGYTLNPGDISWGPLEALGSCRIYDRTAPAELPERAASAAILLTNKVVLHASTINSLPELKYIGVLATGTNVIDLLAARRLSIPVTNVPAYGTKSVAQATFALLLELTQAVGRHSAAVHAGRWTQGPDWCFWEQPLIELDGLTMGIVGAGRIGLAMAALAHAFGMRVLVYTPRAHALPEFVESCDLQTLFRASDVVSLHCPLTDETRQLVNPDRLSWMKPSAFLLNTSRGALVDERALTAALESGRLAGAGLDVLSEEPPPANHPLLRVKNCIITPHNAWGTRAARERLMNIAAENISAFLIGRPINVVN
jgi:glycerate dehydrogenase